MKKRYKILLIVLLISIVVILTSNITLATTIKELDVPARSDFNNVGNAAVKVLSTIGIVLSVAMLIALGIKYMMGSVEEKAEYKRSFLPYVIGASLVFAASSIATIIYNVANNL